MLIGRKDEKSAIADLLESATSSRGGAVVFRGDIGVGKTAVLDHAAVASGGMLLLRAAGVAAETDIAYAAMYELVRPVLDRRDQLPEIQRDAINGALALSTPTNTERFAVGAALYSLLAIVAQDSPLLVLVDDAQWLDHESAQALGFAARRLEHDGVAMIIVTRAQDIGHFSGLPVRGLLPLSMQDARQLLDLRAACPPTDVVAARVLEETRCIPLSVVAAAELLTAEQLTGRHPLPIPLPVAGDTIRQALNDAVGGASGKRSMLLAIAAADTRSIRVLGRLAGTNGDGALTDAERLGLVSLDGDQISFANPFLRSALYQTATADQRREAHRRIAEVLTAPRYRDRRAIHLGKAASAPDEAVAAELEWAGDDYVERVGYGAAAAAYTRAAELSESDPARAMRLFKAASAAWWAGLPHAAERLDLIDDDVPDVLLRADIVHLRSLIRLRGGDSEESSLLESEATRLREHDPARAAAMLVTAAEGRPPAERVTLLRDAIMLAEPVSAELRVRASLGLSLALAEAGLVDEALPIGVEARAALQGDEALENDPELMGLASLTLDPSLPDLTLCTRAVVIARTRIAIAVLPHLLMLQARALEAHGDWTGAIDALLEATRLGDESRQQWHAGAAVACRARLHALRGCETDVADALAELEARGWSADKRGSISELSLGFLACASGDLEAGESHLSRCLDYAAGKLVVDDSRELALDVVELLVRRGRHDQAADVLAATDWEREARPWMFVRLEAARALVGDDREQLASAVGLAERLHPPHTYHRARVQLTYGEVLRRAAEVKKSRTPLRAAIDGFDSVAAIAWSERARTELRATNEHPRSRDPANRDLLTPQERAVADCAIEGLRDVDIGARLFLSPAGVSYHLTKVYKKLGCTPGRGRAELAARLAAHEREHAE